VLIANAVAAGFIATDMTAATAARLGMTFENFQAAAASQVPVRRIGEVDDVAHVSLSWPVRVPDTFPAR
jgi:3-oxoacyl-[acyl-carrier protein] reductase